MFHAPTCDRHFACVDLCALRGRGVEQPADSQPWRCFGLVHTSVARMGLEFHGRDCADPYGAGLPVWSLQVSERTDLDRGCPSPASDPWNGVYRSGITV